MSGPGSPPLKRRLLRAGIGFFIIAVGYVVVRVVWAGTMAGQVVSPDIFLLPEKILLAIVFLSGVVCVLLSRAEGGKGAGDDDGGSARH